MPPDDTSGTSQQNDSAETSKTPVSPGPPQQNTAPASGTQPVQMAAPINPVEQPLGGAKVRKIVLVAGGVFVLAAAGLGWWGDRQNTPTKVFTAAISKLLSTKTITQSVSGPTSAGSIEYDAGNLKDPRVSVSVAQQSSSLTVKLSGYGTLQNDYFKYTSFGSPAVDTALNGLTGKWVQMRTNGTLAKGAATDMESLVDPRSLMFGDFLIGNFSSSDRQQLMHFITANRVYAYDTKQVKTTMVNGRKIYIYAITENIPKLKELNKKLATIIGVPVADIQPVLDQLGVASNTKLYVDAGDKEIVHYSAVQDGDTVIGNYTDYNTTSLPKQPKADLTWSQFQQKQTDITNKLQGGGAGLPIDGAPASLQA